VAPDGPGNVYLVNHTLNNLVAVSANGTYLARFRDLRFRDTQRSGDSGPRQGPACHDGPGPGTFLRGRLRARLHHDVGPLAVRPAKSKAESPISQRASRRHHRRRRLRRRLRLVVAVAVAVAVAVVVVAGLWCWFAPRRGRIVALAEGQVGYRTSPSTTYWNKYSAYWVSGASDCANANRAEQWCADFAAWVWKMAGVAVTYQYINGDLNSSSASFYEWGVANGTRHAAGSGHTSLPGDRTGFSLVKLANDEYRADGERDSAALSGCVSPS
jgi:hypothetical protein